MNSNLKMNEIPKCERPMEKLIKFGPEELNNAELLAVILRTGVKGENIVSLCSRLLVSFDGIDGLLNISFEEVKKLKGIKDVKACQLIAIGELFKRFKILKFQKENLIIKRPKDISEFMINEIGLLDQEVLKLILLGTKNNIMSIKEIFKGSLNSSIVHPREIFREAVKLGSASIIICHNHPSGDPTPSSEDINITLRLKECGNIMGINLLDHIIVGKTKFVSLKEKGII